MRQEHSAEDAFVQTSRASCAAFLIATLAAGCVSNRPADVARFEFAQAQMGLEFRITVYAPDLATASNAVAAAYQRIGELNGILSDYDPDTELSRVSQASGSDQWTRVSPELW